MTVAHRLFAVLHLEKNSLKKEEEAVKTKTLSPPVSAKWQYTICGRWGVNSIIGTACLSEGFCLIKHVESAMTCW